MDSDLYLRFVVTLIGVLALIALIAWVVRRLGLAGRLVPGAGPAKRIGVVEVAALDTRRRLVLVRRDRTEHLLLIGQSEDLVIERGIPAPESDGTTTT